MTYTWDVEMADKHAKVAAASKKPYYTTPRPAPRMRTTGSLKKAAKAFEKAKAQQRVMFDPTTGMLVAHVRGDKPQGEHLVPATPEAMYAAVMAR